MTDLVAPIQDGYLQIHTKAFARGPLSEVDMITRDFKDLTLISYELGGLLLEFDDHREFYPWHTVMYIHTEYNSPEFQELRKEYDRLRHEPHLDTELDPNCILCRGENPILGLLYGN